MGGNSSKKQKKGADGGSPSGVKKRENPNRSNSPLSDPGVGNFSEVSQFPGPNPNFHLRPKEEQDLSGRKYGGAPNRGPTV